ncbi:MAG: methyltransferase [Thermoplasmata archaeon]
MIIREGSLNLEILKGFEKGPGARGDGFYNREMQTSRDFTVSILKIIGRGNALDSMAGTGIRGLRIALEAGWNVVVNDINKKNVEIIERNANENNVNVEIWNKNFFSAVSEKKWDYIDIDPYGSPSGFIEAAIFNLKNNGIIGVTMTDTANLEGKSLKKGFRIYGGISQRGIYSRELATRIFLGYILKRGASLGYGGTPLLVIREKHYIRAFVRFKKGSGVSDKILEKIHESTVDEKKVGPLYMGELYNKEVISSIDKNGLSTNSIKLLERFWNEDLMFLFFTNSRGTEELNMDMIINKLRENGFKAGRTNFYEKGIKTNASQDEFENIIYNL